MRERPPEIVVIGAMKCGTSALHELLDSHPQVSMSRPKELNFFFGPDRAPSGDASGWWRVGQWHRGAQWYLDQLDSVAKVRGESSPGYTDPANPQVAQRMAAMCPDVRLVYCVRDPVQRAVSQWRHHVRDGTETRPVEEALLDPASQYLSRSRYAERLAPFRRHFDPDQVLVVVQERLAQAPERELARVWAHVGLAEHHPSPPRPRTPGPAGVEPDVALEFRARVDDDVERLREWTGDPLPELG